MSALDDLLKQQYHGSVADSHLCSQHADVETEIESHGATSSSCDASGESNVLGKNVAADAPTSDIASTDVPTVDVESENVHAKDVPTQRVHFKPDWEVDRFLWPGVCGDVEERIEQDLQATVQLMQNECREQAANVVVVAAASREAGSTTVTLCLAREAARQGMSVALVDLNHVRPSLMDRLGVTCEEGIESLQKASVTADGICVAAIDDGVSLVPTVDALDVEYCTSETVQRLLDVVAENHDMVLVDASREVVERLSSNPGRRFGTIHVADVDDNSQPIALDVATNRTWSIGKIKNFAA